MSNAIERLNWKEDRFLRPIGIGCLGLLVIACAAGLAVFNRAEDYKEFVFNISIVLGSIAGLSTGIILFVYEREMGTQAFLETLPVESSLVGKSKLWRALINFAPFLLLSIAISGIAVFVLARASFERPESAFMWFAMLAIIPIETLLWSLLCSILMRNSLHATMLSALISIGGVIFVWYSVLSLFFGTANDLFEYQLIVGVHVILIIGLMAVVRASSRHWLRGWSHKSVAAVDVSTAAKSASVVFALPTASPAYPWKALLWQTCRAVRWPWILTAIWLLVTSIVCSLMIGGHQYGGMPANLFQARLIALNLFAIAGFITGLTVFSADQLRNQFLFFQQQTDFSRKLWVARLVPVAAILIVVAITAWIAVGSTTFGDQYYRSTDPAWTWLFGSPFVLNACLLFLATVAVAQLFGMVIRLSSGFITFMVAALVCFCLTLWCKHLVHAGGSLAWYIGPFIAACFATTWWLAPHWISGRRFKTKSAIGIAACTLVLASLAFQWTVDRVNAFGTPDRVGKWTAEYQRFGTGGMTVSESAAIIERALKQIDFSGPDRTEEILSHEKEVKQIIEAVKDPDCGSWLNPRSSVERKKQAEQVLEVLEIARSNKLKNGDLNDALDLIEAELRAAWFLVGDSPEVRRILVRLQRWAEMEGQTEPQIRAALKRLGSVEKSIFEEGGHVPVRETVYEISRGFWSSDPVDGLNFPGLKLTQLPWEIERGRRFSLTSSVDEIRFYWMSACNNAVDAQRVVGITDSTRQRYVPDAVTISAWEDRTRNRMLEFPKMVNAFRYTKVRIALEGWRLKHGSYPKNLEMLSDGENALLARIPKYASTGLDFAYSPEGLGSPVFFDRIQPYQYHYTQGIEEPVYTVEQIVEPGKPFLLPWSGTALEKRVFVEKHSVGSSEETVKRKSKVGFWLPPHSDVELREANVGEYLLHQKPTE